MKTVGGMLEEMALESGLYLYDRRVWAKDPAWAGSRWSLNSYRAVDEFEYLYVFWKPGPTKINRRKLTPDEWKGWGSRGVRNIPSVRKNDDHEAKFPIELPRRAIRLFSEEGDTVLDCFMGSGTTAMAALDTGRHYIGIEKEEKYAALCEKNIREHCARRG